MEGKPNVELTLCKGCKLPYDVVANPEGCPRCKANPNLALAARANEARSAQEKVGAEKTRIIRIGVIVAGGVLLVVTTVMMLGMQSQHHEAELGEGRRHFAERACAMASVEPATPQMEQCITVVLDDCKDRSMSEMPDCTQTAAQRRYAPILY